MILVTEEELDELEKSILHAHENGYTLTFEPAGVEQLTWSLREMAAALNAACGLAFDKGREDYGWDWIAGCCQTCEQDEAFEDRCTRYKPSCHRHRYG